jgi:hypothetical protein
MSQNTSSAVMQQRTEPHDSLDYFPTPPWATRALCEWIEKHVGTLKDQTCWEPACGEGHMARPLSEYFRLTEMSDVHPYGYAEVIDFLFPYPNTAPADWVITNPPFRLAEQFIRRGLDVSTQGVAMLVRTAFLEGVGRYSSLFSPFPPSAILQFSERVPMHKGRLDPEGSTATAYCWIVWLKGCTAPPLFDWIPPCRKLLERPADYEVSHATQA